MPDDESTRPTEEPRAGVTTRPVCNLHIFVTEPDDVVGLHWRHASITDYDVEWERIAFDVDVESDGMKTALTELGENHPDGVELGRLIAALADNGVATGETLDAVRDLRMSSEICEPQNDYVLAV